VPPDTNGPQSSRPQGHDDQELTVFNASRLHRFAILGVLACALLAATTSAAAESNHGAPCRVQLGAGLGFVPCYHDADLQHKSTLTPSADRLRLTAALAQERYYSSYGEPEPMTVPLAPPPPGHTPWSAIALAATVALAAASVAAIERRRLRLRRRVARATF
jgi:peptidoglycan/LPS O-acetylase OafA/YrhL